MSSAVLVPRLPDPSSSFREDAPRPPVPGEEGETPPCQPGVGKGPAAKAPPVSPSARRNEGGLGEPEGRASPDSPLTRWTKSLHSLLGDQDVIKKYVSSLKKNQEGSQEVLIDYSKIYFL